MATEGAHRTSDHSDDRTTHTAGYGLYLLARSRDDTVPTLATRVADRLVGDDGHRPARRTLASLRLVEDEPDREEQTEATDDDTERGVTIRLLDVEDGTGLRDHLEPWATLVAAEGVVTVVDWGTTP